MSVNRWHTKNDVLYDLAQVTGACTLDLDDNYVVVGERPPPYVMSLEDDDEIALRYGHIRPTSNDNAKPDLAGITQMLRMVNDNGDVDDDIKEEALSEPENIIVISKLNPNVQEFVPKNVEALNDEHKTIPDDTSKEITNTKTNNETNSLKNHSLNDINQSSAKLKNDISKTPKDLKGKRERTLAIVTLLKMHTAANSKDHIETQKESASEASKLKLLPPKYFESSENEQNKTKCNDDEKEKQITDSAVINESISTPLGSESPVAPPVANSRVSPSYMESVNKVNDWLNGSVSKPLPEPKPSVYLGPITFQKKNKRKNNESSKTSSTINSSPSLIMSPKKSDISEEDKEKYRKRHEARLEEMEKEKLERMNFWESLEYRLKQLDKKIIEKQMKQQNE